VFPVKHYMKQNGRLWRRVVVALAVGVPLVCGIAAVTGMKASNSGPSTFAPALPRPQTAGQAMKPPHHSPGIYMATPYSMIVVIPQPIDPHMVHATDLTRFKMPCIQPQMHLERR